MMALLLGAFVCSIFLGAALLFLVQPMMGKAVLPLLGGGSAVWNACMVFYQGVLLAGYGYAHLLSRIGDRRRQVWIHAAVIAGAAIVALPIGISPGERPPAEGFAAGWLLLALAGAVGAPFFVLSSAGPLLQSWFAGTRHRDASDPYFLYVASNLGSMLALLAYPFAVEPSWALSTQRNLWSIGFAAFGASALLCGWLSLRYRNGSEPAAIESAEPIAGRERLRLILLAFVPSSLMLGVTQHITTDIAAFPLLWIIPLALYLLTFIVAFSRIGSHAAALATRLLPIAAVCAAMMVMTDLRAWVGLLLLGHLALLAVTGLFAHGRLALARPDTRRLTEFYLLIAVGGVLGGVFNSLVAPLLFDSIAEYPIVVILACALASRGRAGGNRRRRFEDLLLPILLLAVYAGAPTLTNRFAIDGRLLGLDESIWHAVLPGGVCLLFIRHRLRMTLGIAVLFVAPSLNLFDHETIYAARTFYGVHRVSRVPDGSGSWHVLWHGTTEHGAQYDEKPWSELPTTYYARSGPLGEVLETLAARGGPQRLGIVGLGTGTIAAYGRQEWKLTYFEIDPAVVAVARNPELFTYLGNSDSPIEIELGDARLSLAESAHEFDVLVLDAFSSDAIPVHLITREATRLYLDRLASDGLLLFHVTNLHLDLTSVVAGLADEHGLIAMERYDRAITDRERIDRKYESQWIVLARTASALGAVRDGTRWKRLAADPRAPVWTDDYSDPISVLR